LSRDKFRPLDSAAWSQHKYIIIPKALMDAAVRISRFEDFDINAFDAFCVLVGAEERSRRRRWSLVGTSASTEGELPDPGDAFTLSVASQLGADAQHRASRLGSTQFRTALLRRWLLDHASATLASLSVGKEKLPQASPVAGSSGMNQGSFLTRPSHRDFLVKIMKARLFRDDGCSLFNELKVHVQVLMDQLAMQCHARVRQIATEPGGPRLCSFVFSPAQGILPASPYPQARSAQWWGTSQGGAEVYEGILRQDDARVGAVQTTPHDQLERAMEKSDPHHFRQVDEHGLAIHSSEAVRIVLCEERRESCSRLRACALVLGKWKSCRHPHK